MDSENEADNEIDDNVIKTFLKFVSKFPTEFDDEALAMLKVYFMVTRAIRPSKGALADKKFALHFFYLDFYGSLIDSIQSI